MSAVHQFVPMLHAGDAVGTHTLGVRDRLVARGIESKIFVELVDPETEALTLPAASYASLARPGDVLVYQFATASSLAPWLAARSEPLVVNYHNLTPPELFAPWDNPLARHQVRAQGELAQLARRAVLGVGVSEFNCRDLKKAGFARTAVVPPVTVLPDPPTRSPHDTADPTRWLAVGRLAPNKAVEDVLAALCVYRQRHDPHATLLVVGKPAVAVYADALRRFAAELGLTGAVRFAGKIGDAELAEAYATADVLVVASEHEGYCLPVVEAMSAGLPVVAYRQGALPEVLGDAGVLVDQKGPMVVADAVNRLVTDRAWHDTVVAAGTARLPELGLADAGDRLADLLVGLGGGVSR
jgi:glycosyltransferase involved in cell wall biosynthesis